MSEMPSEWFLTASDIALQNFALRRIAHAANLRKDIAVIEGEARREEALAELAHLLREYRATILTKRIEGNPE